MGSMGADIYPVWIVRLVPVIPLATPHFIGLEDQPNGMLLPELSALREF